MRVTAQTTIAEPISFIGVGVHTGVETSIFLRPSSAGGIVFYRTDLSHKVSNKTDAMIAAGPTAVAAAHLGTSIENAHGVSVSTIEHLMAALFICGVDNVMIDVSGPELPILDGSAAPFVEAILQTGLRRQNSSRRFIEIYETVEEHLGDRFIRIEPGADRILDVTIDFEDSMIGEQSVTLDLDDLPALQERLAPARTFCLLSEVEAMRTAGFGRGGSLDNAIVVDKDRMLNEEALRDPSEFALHKALDLLGDLYLLGAPIMGRITAFKPGHDLNTRMARRLEADLLPSLRLGDPIATEARLSA